MMAVSPIDGRYGNKTAPLRPYFSEFALIKYRVSVEVEYFIMLSELPLPQLAGIDKSLAERLRALARNLTEEQAARVKEIEAVTNHDVKAVEYWIKEQMTEWGVKDEVQDFVHFGLTSQDINNTSFPMMLRDALRDVYLPLLDKLIEQLKVYSHEWADITMLAKTHGQPASPTRLGKEIGVFAYRLETARASLTQLPFPAKFGGATGNMNAHKAAYPALDWPEICNRFVSERLGLKREQLTTQISNYDGLCAIFDALSRIGTIVIDLDRDIWQYISMGYFKQRIQRNEVGSSAMPHKVNPIDFENSEGNMGLSGAMLRFLSQKLPISRLQRDLTDSTVLRNIGVPLGHQTIALQSTLKGLGKLLLHKESIDQDLEKEWAVVAEGIQTILRREGYPNPYEALKALTRTNEAITAETFSRFIDSLNVSEAIKQELRQITPQNYTGY